MIVRPHKETRAEVIVRLEEALAENARLADASGKAALLNKALIAKLGNSARVTEADFAAVAESDVRGHLDGADMVFELVAKTKIVEAAK